MAVILQSKLLMPCGGWVISKATYAHDMPSIVKTNIVIVYNHKNYLSLYVVFLPLNMTTVRFQNVPIEYRLCTMCKQNNIET